MANVLADDLDRTVDTPETPVLPWRFSFGSRNKPTVYDIDLTQENYNRLEEALRVFIDAGRAPTDASSPTKRDDKPKPAGGKSDTAKAREWAKETGWKDSQGKKPAYSGAGRASKELLEAWKDATSEQAS